MKVQVAVSRMLDVASPRPSCVHAEAAPRVELLSRDLEITAARVIRDGPKKKEQKHIEVSEAEADDTEDESSQRGHEGEEEEKVEDEECVSEEDEKKYIYGWSDQFKRPWRAEVGKTDKKEYGEVVPLSAGGNEISNH